MKTLHLFLSLLMLSILTVSCENENIIGQNNNSLKKGQIEIKVYPNDDNKVSFYVMAKKITIDWGDGSVDELTPNGVWKEFIHEYVNQNFQTILISTEEATVFYDRKGVYNELRFGDCPDLEKIYCNNQKLTVLDIKKAVSLTSLECYSNQLTSLDLSKCTALTGLGCDDNQLTSLDLSKCLSLTKIDCRSNQLTDVALNTLFESLPQGYGKIYFYDNPGSWSCDQSIATNKGWDIYN